MKRQEWIDYLRGATIVLMIIGHTNVPELLNNWIYGFHVPLFFVISGFLYNKEKWENAGIGKFAVERLRNYIIPYFIWCGMCFIVNLPMIFIPYSDNCVQEIIQNIGWIFTSVVKEGAFLPQNCTPLWFLTTLFVSQIVFFFMIKVNAVLQCVLSALFIAVNYLLILFDAPILPWHLEVSLIGAVLMLIGYEIKKYDLISRVKSKIFVLFAFVIATAIILYNSRNGYISMYYRYYSNMILFLLGASLMSYVMMFLCKNYNFKFIKPLFSLFGRYSIIVLGLNYSINRYVSAIVKVGFKLAGMKVQNVNWLVLTVINILICLFAIKVFIKLASKFPKLNILVGKRTYTADVRF